MAERHNDQAEGLRRMFRAERLRVIHVLSGCAGVGRLTVAANLALAMAKAGRETLLIDVIESHERRTALDALGLGARVRKQATSAPVVAGPHGLAVMTVDQAWAQAPSRAALVAASRPLLAYTFVTDSSTRCARWLPVDDERRDFVIVLSRAPASITDAYALIKRMSAAGVCRSFHVLVNRVGSEAEATLIFRNIAQVARGYLDVDLRLLGCVPADPALEHAPGLRRSLAGAEDQSPAATAFARLAHKISAWSYLSSTRVRSQRERARSADAA